jgi:SIT4 phosphatase-associated protein
MSESLPHSDYDIEPVLSLTLESHPPTSRDPIYLGTMLRLFASRINDFQRLLAKPRSVPASIATTFGHIEPLGFERFRICELYAELLHCSNMVLLNDPRGEEIVRERDIERERLRKEARPNPTKADIWDDTNLGNGRQRDADMSSSDGNEEGDTKVRADIGISNGDLRQKYVSNDNYPESRSVAMSNEDEAQSNLEFNIVISQEQGREGNNHTHDSKVEEHDPESTGVQFASALHSVSEMVDTVSKKVKNFSAEGVSEKQLVPSPLDPSDVRPVVGDYLKMQFVEAKILPSMVDLFFAHPWNNFLHNVVYDILTQALNGPMDKGFNRQLAVDLFTTGQLTEKILQGQKASDEAQ